MFLELGLFARALLSGIFKQCHPEVAYSMLFVSLVAVRVSSEAK